MEKKICDRCHQESNDLRVTFQGYPQVDTRYLMLAIVKGAEDARRHVTLPIEIPDLCPACIESFTTWWKT